GKCHSCWAFSTTGSLEGQYKKKTNKLVSLSEQQLVDCSRKFGNEGCHGGLMNNAFEYLEESAIESEASYPYEARDNVCRYDESAGLAKVTGIMKLPEGNETALQIAVATAGPVSVAIDIDDEGFMMYK
ncbi:unnamed protein product, partial [Protopolystoma xenopodis]